MAIKIKQYTETKHDHVKCGVDYAADQDHPSPAMMADYKFNYTSRISDVTFYQTHALRAPASAPYSTDACMQAYVASHDAPTWIYEMGNVFSSNNKSPETELGHYQPKTLNFNG